MVSVHTAVGWSESTMNDDDDVTEKLLDALVYAPLGLALEAKDLLPKLAKHDAFREFMCKQEYREAFSPVRH